MNWLEKFYCWFWYHTEFWIADKFDRRPYTYIMRDWLFTHVGWFWVILAGWAGGLLTLSRYHGSVAVITGILTAMLLGHLVWGTRWIPEEQEDPPYDPDETGTLQLAQKRKLIK